MKKLWIIIIRCLKIYIWYIVSIIIVFLSVLLLNGFTSSISADFEGLEETNESDSESRINYNYFLDFSPSMKGFFDEDINSSMHMISEIFEQINSNNENNYFFWCSDIIENISEASIFYQSMKTTAYLENYYSTILNSNLSSVELDTSENGGLENLNPLIEIIDNIDLSKIFTENFGEIELNQEDLNVIITDMNFLKNENDLEGHNRKIQNLAQYLGERVGNANISIYSITTNFKGVAYDESIFLSNTLQNVNSDITAIFYLIIFSNNNRGYKRYCQRFENALSQAGISYNNKFELLNQIYNSEQRLKVDLDTYKSLAMITNENLNFANGLFEDLDDNEFALQLVSEGRKEGHLAMPVSEVNFSGYYFSDAKGLDNTNIDIEVELYQPLYKVLFLKQHSYERYEDETMVLYKSARMYYEDEKWYIRIDINLSTSPKVPQQNSFVQDLLKKIRREYIVMNLKFYMVDPSYLKPSWVDTMSYPNISNENILKIGVIIDEIIQNKEKVYHLQSEENRYLGNVVVYILY